MLLNPDKSEAILVGTKAQRGKLSAVSGVEVAGSTITFCKSLTCLGVTIDSSLSLDSQVTSIVKSCNYHIKALRHIRPVLSREVAETVARSNTMSRLDYCNSILAGSSKKSLESLQRVQNSLARVVAGANWRDHITPVLRELHWLPVARRIDYKLAILTYKIRLSHTPYYLAELIDEHVPVRVFRSSCAPPLATKSASSVLASRAFSNTAPNVWNSLPDGVRCAGSLEIFKRLLKTYLFNVAYDN